MVPAKSSVAIAATFVSLVVGAHPTAAEWFADLYGGAAFTERHRFSLDGKLDGVAVAGFVKNVSYDKAFSLGGRGGCLFQSVTVFGLGPDASHFLPAPRSPNQLG